MCCKRRCVLRRRRGWVARAINLRTPQRTGSWSWATLLRQIAFFVILLLVWQGISISGIWPSFLFPGPLAVATNLISGFQSGIYVTAILVSLRRLAIGYGISVVFGV